MNRPETTLFLIQSVDGKISTGIGERDVDKDYPLITGLKEGLNQYYELEQKTDAVSFNTGKVIAKIGVNTKKKPSKRLSVDFVIVDNKPHLTSRGVDYLCDWVNKLYLATKNVEHPAYNIKKDNLKIINYSEMSELFEKLHVEFSIKKMTVQSGGTMNAELIRNNLIDKVSIVIAPALVGGRDTPTLIDGISLETVEDLLRIKSLRLREMAELDNSYIHLVYDVSKQKLQT